MYKEFNKLITLKIIKKSLNLFGIAGLDIKLIQNNANYIYNINNEEFILRITPSYLKSKEEIESEVEWMIKLKEYSINTAAVIPSRNNKYFEIVKLDKSKYLIVVLFKFIQGIHLNLNKINLDFANAQGQSIGKLHKISKKYSPANHTIWQNGTGEYIKSYLLEFDYNLLSRFNEVACKLIEKDKNVNNFGLCHGDLHTNNLILDKNSELHIIDFGNCEEFYYLYDIVVVLQDYFISYEGNLNLTKLFESFLEGYNIEITLKSFSFDLFSSLYIYRSFLTYSFFGNLKYVNNRQVSKKLKELKLDIINSEKNLRVCYEILFSLNFLEIQN